MTPDKALELLGKKIARASRRKDVPAIRKYVRRAGRVGRFNKRTGYTRGSMALELHWNQREPNKQELHVEYFDGAEERIIAEKGIEGVNPQEINSKQEIEGSCEWGENSWSATLDQAIVELPGWLGGQLNIPAPQGTINGFIAGLSLLIS